MRMRIACPACAAAYEVPDRLLAGPARTLRCSRCGKDFALPRAAAEPEAAAPPVMAAEPLAPALAPRDLDPVAAPAPVVRPEPLAMALPAAGPQASRALVGAWIASLAVVAAAVAGFLVFHGKVMEVWPASTRLFAALGLA